MKLRNKSTVILSIILAFIVVFTLTGCSEAPAGSSPSYAPDVSDDKDSASNNDANQAPIKKQLTAAEWRDAKNYDFWLKLFEKGTVDDTQGEENQIIQNGIFYEYATATRGLDTANMHEINVISNGNPVVGATVKLYNGNEVVYTAVSDSAGKAYVFGNGTQVEAVSGEFQSAAEVANGATEITLSASKATENELEIMLVVDTTGSMSDELKFLCEELAGVVTRVSKALQCKIRLGLLFYRDEGDAYVTRKFDFTAVNSTDGLNSVVKNINAQKSEGGGDYPEAVHTALKEAVEADWHTDSKTRLLFHVLDAPYHDGQEIQSSFANAVKSAARKGIRIIPVAASGLDTLGQYIMRSAALLTGGTYAFLTDDSGIGDSHEIPDVGEFTVEYLSDLMVRLIKGYYTGEFEEPISWKQADSEIK